jgi:hypothetical protein
MRKTKKQNKSENIFKKGINEIKKNKKELVFYIIVGILVIIALNIFSNIEENGFNLFGKNPLKNTIWRSTEKDLLDTFKYIKFDDKEYEITSDWSTSTSKYKEKIPDEIQLEEQGRYKVKDSNSVHLKPAIYIIGKGSAEDATSTLGANLLIIEDDTLTVMDGKKYKKFRKL